MIPKTKAHIPPEIEQEMTIEPPVKRFFGVLVIGMDKVMTIRWLTLCVLL